MRNMFFHTTKCIRPFKDSNLQPVLLTTYKNVLPEKIIYKLLLYKQQWETPSPARPAAPPPSQAIARSDGCCFDKYSPTYTV